MTTSLRFDPSGKILGYEHPNECSWRINDENILEILSHDASPTWKFEAFFIFQNKIYFFSGPSQDPEWGVIFNLIGSNNNIIEKSDIIPPEYDLNNLVLTEDQYLSGNILSRLSEGKNQQQEGIRLVIWDLDDTFWKGTLSEGEISPIQRNIDIVKTLNARGIVNAICSRNTFEDVKARLEQLRIWDDFVFPRISWGPKGPLVKDIIEKIQLRPETVLFIDDNVTNLNEAKHFVPELNVAEPAVLENLLDNPRFKGKTDPEHSRLKRYQVLESKHKDMAATGGDNEAFLRKSDIRVSFHSDIEAEFPRIHDLVNRTNQLNFTKNRWPEDIEEARLRFREEVEADFDTDVGYVKVADAYGNYGICGFYLSRKGEFLHFLFSCRTMNMGVEQFVWRRLGERRVPIQGKVGSKLEDPIVDWINVVEDVDKATDASSFSANRLKVCIRGACDMMMTSNFLRTKVDTVEEFNYPYEGWEIVTTPRIVYVAGEDLKDQRNREIVARFPAMPPHRFDTDILEETSDVYVLSFSQESFHGLYQSKTTGMILPLGNVGLPWYYMPGGHAWDPYSKNDYTKLTYQEVLDWGITTGCTKDQWEFFREEFIFFGGFNKELFENDIHYIFNRLRNANKKVIILGLNSKIGKDIDLMKFNEKINIIVEPIVAKYGFHYLKMENFVKSEDDLANDGALGGAHFDRLVYKNISDKILNITINYSEKLKNS
ncbi:HAD-IIIC family phosphatase [Acetobacter oryzoeni]|uniref:HAD-IIIC family phosphatase n=2 Tax=Acetobacter oryzoeni TaxID=2500548 RepID=A0A5B9GPD6_9PROT|nr:HAD-IIIC family phosphatase [Acetobacter oryzoeni]